MAFNSTDLLTKLRASTAVTNIVGTYGGQAAIFFSVLVPEDYRNGTTGYNGKAINYYLISPADPSADYGDYIYSLNCRGPKQSDALSLQNAVISAINRLSPSDGGCIFLVTALPVIRPADGTDDYNAPCEVRIKARRA